MSRPFHNRKSRGSRNQHFIRRCSGFGKMQGEDATSELAYDWSMESSDICSGDNGGSNATLVEGPFYSSDLLRWRSDLAYRRPSHLQQWSDQYKYTVAYSDRLNRAERRFIKRQAGCIVHESSDGFVTVVWFETKDSLMSDWDRVCNVFYSEFDDFEGGGE